MHRLVFFVILCGAIGGCTSPKNSRSPDVVYDNRGGYAYGGLRITFRPSGTYEIQSYTDVVGHDTVTERGTYERRRSTYVLNHDGVQRVYHTVTVRGIEYLLDSRKFDDYSRTRARELLHAAMRRAA